MITTQEIENTFEKAVAELPFFHQVAFVYRISERLFPNYVQFVENEHFGNIETLQKGLDLLKEIVLTETVNQETKEKIATLLPEIDAVIPDTEDYGSLQAGLALDACGAVYDALLGILEEDTQKISAVAFLPFNSAEMIIYSKELDSFDLVLAEKIFQENLLALAKSTEKAGKMIEHNFSENIETMKAVTKKEGIVYVLVNPAHQQGLVKIGKTVNQAEVRAKQLYQNGGAAIPDKFIVAYSVEVSDCSKVERAVHDLLDNYRWNADREFFEIPLKKAIDTIYRVVNDLVQQYAIDILVDPQADFTEKQWWASLDLAWKQVLRKHLTIDYQANSQELIQAVHAIIDHSRDEALRNQIAELIADSNFSKKIEKWYQEKMPKRFKNDFDSFVSYSLNEKQIRDLWNLRKLDCQTVGVPIRTLQPLSQFSKLEELNLRGLKITSENFSPLASLKNLKSLNCSQTNLEDLLILKDLKNLEVIKWQGTKISPENIEAFKNYNPQCQVDSKLDNFLSPSEAKEPKKKK